MEMLHIARILPYFPLNVLVWVSGEWWAVGGGTEIAFVCSFFAHLAAN